MRFGYLRVFIGILVVLCLLEVALEARAYRRGYASLLFGAGAVRFEVEAAEGPELEVGPTPEFPFRSAVIPTSKPEATVRIWLGSASHGEDIAVSVPDVFPNRMGAILEEAILEVSMVAGSIPATQIQVLNASRGGLIIDNNSNDLLELGEAWKPDIAILYGLSMDLGVLSERFLGAGGGAAESRDAAEGDASPREDPNQAVTASFQKLDELYEQTTIYAQLKSNLTTLVTRQRLLPDSLPRAAQEPLRRSLHGFVDAAIQVGATPILTTFATRYGWDDTIPLPLAAEKFMVRYNPYLKPSGWVMAIHTLNEVIREVGRERGVFVVDLEPHLTNEHQLFRDPVHFTPDGHERVATLLAEGVAEAMGWSEGGDRE